MLLMNFATQTSATAVDKRELRLVIRDGAGLATPVFWERKRMSACFRLGQTASAPRAPVTSFSLTHIAHYSNW